MALLLFSGTSAHAERENPFDLPPGVMFLEDVEVELEEKPLPLRLDGVILGQKKVAIINNRNYLLGQEIAGRKLLEVHKDHVLLQGEEGPVELMLERKPFTVRVTHPPTRGNSN